MKQMLQTPIVLTLTALMVLLSFSGCAQMKTEKMADPPLYNRLGGYDAVAAVVDDFLGRMAGDPDLKGYFEGMDKKSGMKTRQLIVDMVCQVTGGPCYYTGRDMVTTHTGMGITEAHWDISVKHFIATLDKFKVPAKEKNELLAIVGPLKGDIVGK